MNTIRSESLSEILTNDHHFEQEGSPILMKSRIEHLAATSARLIINSPYREPAEHWKYDAQARTFSLIEGAGRRDT